MQDSLNTHYLSRKIHSLLGLVPVGVFLAFHLWENSMARKGAAFFNTHVVEHIEITLNYKVLIELLLAAAILAHAVYGFVVWWQGRSNVRQYRYGANVRYLIQRITSFTVFAFIVWHVWHTRIYSELHDSPAIGASGRFDFHAHMQSLFENPWIVALYVVGVVSATFHLANGLWLAGITWGVTTHARAQRISLYVCGLIFVLLTALGLHSIWGFMHPYA